MSTSAVPADLMNGAECIDRCIPDGMKMSALINIFAKLANLDTNPKALMDGAVCIDRCIPDGMKMAALIYAMTQVQGGGGGVTGTLSAVSVSPTVAAFGGSWLNNTGAPVLTYTRLVMQGGGIGSPAIVDVKADGVVVGRLQTETDGIDQFIPALILPGKIMAVENTNDPTSGNIYVATLAFKLVIV